MNSKNKKIVENMLIAEGIYNAVVDQLNIDKNDSIYRDLMVGILKRQTRDHLVFSIWTNLNSAQLNEFRNFVLYNSGFSEDDLLFEFVKLYPEVLKKVYKSLTDFFRRFIDTFNRINRA